MNFGLSKLVAIGIMLTGSPAQALGAERGLVGLVRDPSGTTQALGSGTELRTPLGSLYKLYVYAYLLEKAEPETRYVCRGRDPEEVFCCVPGESIDRDRALAKSCSPYFSFNRLGLKEAEWRRFWKERVTNAPDWLASPPRLRPETVVSASEIVDSLSVIRSRFAKFPVIQAAALGSVLYGTASNALKDWGSTLRVKTYTWRDAETRDRTDEQGFTGGFAGWLPDGSAIWVSRAGHGKEAFQKELQSLVAAHLPTLDSGCVRVRFFDRYPIRSITPENERPRGPVEIRFTNGNRLRFVADGSLRVSKTSEGFKISSEMGTEQYVARVLDREAGPEPREAARALAVSIRTFLYQNARETAGCREIGDSSHFQRVSPQSPSPASLEIARWTEGLVLDGVENLRYHSTKASPGRMSWVQAREQAQNGDSMAEILRVSYPAATLAYGTKKDLACDPNPSAVKWVLEQSKRWRARLVSETGFEEPSALKICQSEGQRRSGSVHADLVSQAIFVPRLRTSEDEASVLHEYLHIAFRDHPRGTDETFVENLARKLLEVK